MCDVGDAHDHGGFGFLVDTPDVRALVDETHRLTNAPCPPDQELA